MWQPTSRTSTSESYLLVLTPPCTSFCTGNGRSVQPTGYGQNHGVRLARSGHQGHRSFHSLLCLCQMTRSETSQLPRHVETHAALRRAHRVRDRGLWPTASSPECAIWTAEAPAAVQPSDDCGPGRHLDCDLMRDPATHSTDSCPLLLWEIIFVCCFILKNYSLIHSFIYLNACGTWFS